MATATRRVKTRDVVHATRSCFIVLCKCIVLGGGGKHRRQTPQHVGALAFFHYIHSPHRRQSLSIHSSTRPVRYPLFVPHPLTVNQVILHTFTNRHTHTRTHSLTCTYLSGRSPMRKPAPLQGRYLLGAGPGGQSPLVEGWLYFSIVCKYVNMCVNM